MGVELKTKISFVVCFVSDSLQPHGLQHARLPCPSLSPRVCPNSYLLSQWCHPAISSSSVPPISFCLQSFPASGPFPVSWLFASSGPSIQASVSASILPNLRLISFRIDWFDLLAVQGTLQSLLQQFKSISSSAFSLLSTLTSKHDYWKNHSFD